MSTLVDLGVPYRYVPMSGDLAWAMQSVALFASYQRGAINTRAYVELWWALMRQSYTWRLN